MEMVLMVTVFIEDLIGVWRWLDVGYWML